MGEWGEWGERGERGLGDLHCAQIFSLALFLQDFFVKETKPKVGLCNCRTFFLN